jgi:hypothetical protein
LKKRIKKIAGIAGIVLTLMPVSAYFLIKLPVVQSFLVHQITATLSEKLYPASVSVGAVHYSFLTKLLVDDVLVTDLRGDTLLFVNETSFTVAAVHFTKKKLTLSDIHLYNGAFHLYIYALNDDENSTNIKDIVTHLKGDAPPDTTSVAAMEPAARWAFSVRNITLDGFRFTFCNRSRPTAEPDSSVVDFKNLRLHDIHVEARNLRLERDTLFFALREVRFTEQSGYRLQQLTAESGHVCGTQAFLSRVTLIDNHSHLTMRYYKMDYESAKSFNDYVSAVRMEADFDNARFSFRTVGHMAKNFRIYPDLYLTGVAGGTVDYLRSDRLQVRSESSDTRMTLKFRMTGLPDIRETLIYVIIPELQSTTRDLERLLQGFTPVAPLNLAFLYPLERFSLRGSFTGLYNDFVTQGVVRSGGGEAHFDLSLVIGRPQGVQLKGDVQALRFPVGKLLPAVPLGDVSGVVTADGSFLPADRGGVCLHTKGTLSHVDFAGYPYKNVEMNTVVRHNGVEGAVNIDDPNLDLAFGGRIDYTLSDTGAACRMNFETKIDHADLTALHLNTRDSVSLLKASVKVDYAFGAKFYDGSGQITVSDLRYARGDEWQKIGDLHLHSVHKPAACRTTLRSEFLTADYAGTQPLSHFLARATGATAGRHLPALAAPLPAEDSAAAATVDCQLTVVTKEAATVADILLPGLYVAPKTELTARLTANDSLHLRLSGSELQWNGYRLRKAVLTVDNNRLRSRAELRAAEALLPGITLRNVVATGRAACDTVDVQLTYDNKTAHSNYGRLAAVFTFGRTPDEPPYVGLQIYPSELTINDSVWRIAPSHIRFNEKIHIRHFHVNNHLQSLHVDGTLSEQASDTLTLQLERFDIANLNILTESEGYRFSGLLSGRARVTDLYHTPRFFADIRSDETMVNGNLVGGLILRSFWDDNERQFNVNIRAQKEQSRPFDVRGYYSPGRNYIDMTASFDRFPLVHIEPLLDGVLTQTQGSLSGTARCYGRPNRLTLEGVDLMADNVAATVDYLKTRYSFRTPVLLNSTTLGFKDAEVSDEFGGKATLSVLLMHEQFRQLHYEITAYPRNLCVLNTAEKDNEFFYGRAFASGAAVIKGRARETRFDINLKTERNTVVHIPASSSGSSRDTRLLTFAEPPKDSLDDGSDGRRRERETVRKAADLEIALNVNVTPETEIQIELDPQTGDHIRSFGNGNIKMDINPANGKFNLFGDYTVDRGDYAFSIQNFSLITKKFHVEQGGRIAFNGDLHNTHLDLLATYKTKASLNNLLVDSSSVVTRRPVDCKIYITGNMFRPALRFDIEVPNLDAETRARVQSALSTDEKRTQQFLSLLAFGTFLSDQEVVINTSGMLAGSATELLANQVNTVFNQLNVPLDIGFTYLPSQEGRNDAYDMNFSTQLLNRRLMINGSFGSGNSRTQAFSNDFNLDILLGSKEKLYLKFFTRSVDQYTDNIDNSQRYGVGLMYREEFATFGELMNRIFGRKKSKPTTPPPPPEEKDPAQAP